MPPTPPAGTLRLSMPKNRVLIVEDEHDIAG
jgi:hypothetical protein